MKGLVGMNNLNTYITGVQHIGIPTNDMKKTIEFYKELGFLVINQTMNGEEKVVFLQNQNLVIEAYQNNTALMKTGSINHICLDVTNIDVVYNLLKEKQNVVSNEIEFLPFWENGIKYFIIEGPNKEKIEFCQRLA